MSIEILIAAFFLGAAVILYCVLAGADFGAGMLEIFLNTKDREAQEKIVTRALSPVWEANHVWLVIAVVVLFVAFPQAYTAISIHLHIPLSLMLIGVILRGCAFTFRHYDAVRGKSYHWYTAIFVFSSFLTPLTLGVLAGAVAGIYRDEPVGLDFYSQYVQPWCNVFCLTLGVFTCILFSFLAAVYLLGEEIDAEMRARLRMQARYLNIAAILGGLALFAAGEYDNVHLLKAFIGHLPSLLCMALATIAVGVLWLSLAKRRYQLARIFAALQVALVVVGWMALQAPYLYRDREEKISLFSAGANPATVVALDLALVVGSALIFPALGYLLWTFKNSPRTKASGASV